MPSPEQCGPLVVGSDRSGGSGMSVQHADLRHSCSTYNVDDNRHDMVSDRSDKEERGGRSTVTSDDKHAQARHL
jgi:hypothetical protein